MSNTELKKKKKFINMYRNVEYIHTIHCTIAKASRDFN